MTPDAKRYTFERFRRSLAAAGMSTADANAMVCPLCWRETPYNDLSVEHIVPRSVGGRQTTLTCRRCNNSHGRDLDAHLARYQHVRDGFQGFATLKTKLNVNGHELSANLDWREGYSHFRVVNNATNPDACDATQREFSDGNVEKITFTLNLGYNKDRYHTAVLRAAYLVLFDRFGYEYARHEIAQRIRSRIADPSLNHPSLASLIMEARSFTPPYDAQHYVVPGNVNGVGFFLVIIRVRCKTTSYFGAYLPAPVERCNEFFDLMELFAKENNGKTLTIPTAAIFG